MASQPPARPMSPRFEQTVRRAVTNRRIFPWLVLTTVAIAALSGFVVTVIDQKDFPNFGTGVWWAIVTIATVGYGDVVPHTGWGRVVGSAVIVVGVTFVSFLIAIVTSYFVAAEEGEKAERERQQRDQELTEARDSLRRIEERLASIETRLEAGGT